MGGIDVLYLLGTAIYYPKIKAKSCISCERFVNDLWKIILRPPPLPLTHPCLLWNNIKKIFP